MRYILLALLLLPVSLLAACSYVTDFVVVNESSQPVRVRYWAGAASIDPVAAAGKPALLAASRLKSSDRQWRELAPRQYDFDRESGWVTIALMTGEGLRVTRQKDWGVGTIVEIRFPIEEIHVLGTGGEITLKDYQVYKGFVQQSETLCTLTYRRAVTAS